MNNAILKINTKNFKEIMWTLVLIYTLRIAEKVSEEVLFFVYILLIILLIGFAKKIIIPQLPGVLLYAIVIFYTTIVGFTLYNARNVERDFFYVVPTVIVIVLGYYANCAFDKRKSIVKTLAICAVINFIYVMILLARDISVLTDFQETRKVFNIGAFEVGIISIVLLSVILDKEKTIFGKKIDVAIFAMTMVQIVMSLSRSVWVEFGVGLIALTILKIAFNKNRKGLFVKIIGVTAAAVIGVMVLFTYAPEEVTEIYTNKIENTAEEMSTETEINSTSEAMSNWRSYENKSAISQWKKSNAIIQVFGEGLGRGVYLKYVPDTWTDLDSDRTIPILHNAYYTILPKGGIVGVIALLWFVFAGAYVGIKALREGKGDPTELIILVSMSLIMIIEAYAVRGPVNHSTCLVWGLLSGWIYARMFRNKKGEADTIDGDLLLKKKEILR